MGILTISVISVVAVYLLYVSALVGSRMASRYKWADDYGGRYLLLVSFAILFVATTLAFYFGVVMSR